MSFSKFLCLSLLCLIFLLRTASAQYTGPAAGQKVEFLGDSITQLGWDASAGYLHLVDMALTQAGYKIEVIPAGISGQTSKDMLARIGDVLSKKPDWLLVSCGVNDVWHGAQGVPLDQYKVNITSMVDQAKAAGAKVVILASTPIGYTNFKDDNNTKLVAYNEFLRDLAAKDGLPFVDLNTAMANGSTQLTKANSHQPGDMVTGDGVHPTPIGFEIMAGAILKTWGFTDAQLAEVTASWEQIPNGMSFGNMLFDNNSGMTIHDYLLLRTYAESQNKAVRDVIGDMIKADVKKITDATSASPAKP